MSRRLCRVREKGQHTMNRAQLLSRFDTTWDALQASYAGLADAELVEPGVVEEWSVKDVMAHVTTWEEEALKYLPLIADGGTPPRYATFGGLDAFNARMSAQKQDLSLAEVRRQMDDTHRRLRAYIETVPDELFTRETRFRHRLRLDTYSHYPIHTKSIREWREGRESRQR
jgi:hypothetical protein